MMEVENMFGDIIRLTSQEILKQEPLLNGIFKTTAMLVVDVIKEVKDIGKTIILQDVDHL